MSAQVGYVGPPRHPPGDSGRGQPAAARRGRPVDLGAHDHAPAALRRRCRSSPTSRPRPRAAAATTTRSRRASASASGTASSSWRRTRSRKVLHQQPRLLRRRRRRRVRGRLLGEHVRLRGELRPRVPRRPPQLRVLGQLRAAVRQGQEVGHRLVAASRTRSSAAGSSAASSRRAPASRSRSRTVAPARCRATRSAEWPNCVGDPVPVQPEHHVGPERAGRLASGSTSTPSRRRRSARSATAGSASHARRATPTSTPRSRSASHAAATRYLEFRVEAFNVTNHAELRPARARHQRAEHVRPDHEHGQLAARGRARR